MTAEKVGVGITSYGKRVSTRVESSTEYVVFLNKDYRQLSKSQLAMVGARLMEYEREQAKKRMAAGGGDKVSAKAKRAGEKKLAHPVREPQSREIAGAKVGVSGPLADEACYTIEHGVPELEEQIAISQFDKFQPSHATEIARHFGKSAWSDDTKAEIIEWVERREDVAPTNFWFAQRCFVFTNAMCNYETATLRILTLKKTRIVSEWVS